MNILVLSWRDHKHPQAGGAEQVMRKHMKGWIKTGHNVTTFSSRFVNCKKYEKSDGIETFHSGDQYIGVKINAFNFWFRNHKKFDLVVDQFHGIPFFTTLYIRKPKLAILQEVAREVWFLNGFPFPLNYLIGFVGFISEPLIFLFYKKIPFMVGSKSARTDLVKMGIPAKNITIVPHGVILPSRLPHHIPNTNLQTNPTITYLGALTKDKGVEDAVVAFSILGKNKNYRFWIIGKGDVNYTKYLKDLAEKMRILDRVSFWGYVTTKKKFELLARSSVLINPSVREGWGLVNIEANSVGTPVIAYSSAGLIDSVKDGVSGVILEKNNPKTLAQEINRIISHKVIYQKLQKGAISWSKEFNWDDSIKKSQKLILRVCK